MHPFLRKYRNRHKKSRHWCLTGVIRTALCLGNEQDFWMMILALLMAHFLSLILSDRGIVANNKFTWIRLTGKSLWCSNQELITSTDMYQMNLPEQLASNKWTCTTEFFCKKNISTSCQTVAQCQGHSAPIRHRPATTHFSINSRPVYIWLLNVNKHTRLKW